MNWQRYRNVCVLSLFMSLEQIKTDKGLATSRHLADKGIFLGVVLLVSSVVDRQ
jgi:hypothetical protein